MIQKAILSLIFPIRAISQGNRFTWGILVNVVVQNLQLSVNIKSWNSLQSSKYQFMGSSRVILEQRTPDYAVKIAQFTVWWPVQFKVALPFQLFHVLLFRSNYDQSRASHYQNANFSYNTTEALSDDNYCRLDRLQGSSIIFPWVSAFVTAYFGGVVAGSSKQVE